MHVAYRNFFTLTSDHLKQLLAAFATSLQDEQLETRTLASKTLSGLIKVLPPDLFAAVKSEILKEARVAFPTQKSASAPASVVQLHSCVLKLASLLQSRPYELADWCAPPTMAFCTLCDGDHCVSVAHECWHLVWFCAPAVN
jgi:hypothetical protein